MKINIYRDSVYDTWCVEAHEGPYTVDVDDADWERYKQAAQTMDELSAKFEKMAEANTERMPA